MSLKKIVLAALAVLVVCGSFALPCHAQNSFRHRPLRWLGQGFSDGYHRCNPGYDTSYYNPYSAHNSNLISQSPEYMAINPVPTNQELPQRFFNGIPFSAYAAPPQLNQTMQIMPGQQFEGSFSPSTGSDLSDDTGDSDSDNSFRPSDDDNDEAEDNDFRDDDDDFRERQDDDLDADENMDADEDMDADGLEDRGEDDDVDTSDLGGLSGLNNSLSFDFD